MKNFNEARWHEPKQIMEILAKHCATPAPAESGEVERLRTALQKLINYDFECNCEHDNENCCELNNVFCPRCIAARALMPKVAESPAKGEEVAAIDKLMTQLRREDYLH